MIGIGIDTGGTYTDAVIYNLDVGELLASDKSLTTKDDLKIGITNVLKKLPRELLSSCEMLSLSTTLATNACVEHRGGKGKLILIGLAKETLLDVYKDYGIDSLDDVYILECKIDYSPNKSTQPDWERFKQDLPVFCKHCDCVSVVQLFAKEHLASYEKKAASIIKEALGIPVILGHELFPDLNIIRRGAGALLNARLIPIIGEFLKAIKDVFHSFNLTPPTIIVKSDGTLMSEEYTSDHPVETLLCGPAASIMGAMALVENVDQALIVDMGGTTTDVAIVKDNNPLTVKDGIQIGDWKTFVKGVFIDTFALGGDTAIHYDYDGSLFLEKYRVIPLCTLASNYPSVISQLKELENRPQGHSYYLHEFYCLIKDIEDNPNYSDLDKDFCRALKNGPLIFTNAAKAIGKDIYTLKVSHLEEDGIIIRSGLTPTDIMHIKGDFDIHDVNASRIAATFIAAYMDTTILELCERVYDMIQERLYCNLVRILLQEEYDCYKNTTLHSQMEDLIHLSYQRAKQGKHDFFSTSFQTKAKLIGVGAPTHIFIEAVAKLLGTTALIPEHASVANAIGAIVGNVSVTKSVELKPIYENDNINGYQITSAMVSKSFDDYDNAYEYAIWVATDLAVKAALHQGAINNLTTTNSIKRKETPIGSATLFLSEIISVTATGKIY